MTIPTTWSLATMVTTAVARLRGRYALLAIVLALSTGVSVFGAVLGGYTSAQSATDAKATEQLRTITVYPDRTRVTDDALATIARIPGVTKAVPFVRVIAGIASTGDTVSLVGIDADALPPNLTDGSFGFSQCADDHWIVLPASIDGHDYRTQLGKTIRLTTTVATDSETGTGHDTDFTVTGLNDPSYQVDAVDAGYIPLSLARTLYLQRLGVTASELGQAGGYEKATAIVDDQAHVNAVVAAIQGSGLQAISRSQEIQAVPGLIAIIRVISTIVTVGLMLLCILTTSIFAVALVRQRTKEMGVLRASGWSSRRVQGVWTAEFVIVSLVSVVFGCALGALAVAGAGEAIRSSLSRGSLGALTVDPVLTVLPVLGLVIATCGSAAAAIWAASRQDIASLMRSLG